MVNVREHGLDYVHLAMPRSGEQRARKFYGDVLGLAEIVKPPNPASHRGVWFRSGDIQLHLGVTPDWPAATGFPALFVEDLRKVVERLILAGYQATVDLDPPRGFDRAFATDPFGNPIELVQQRAARTAR